jgi:sugar phosphate isomerase/epimerase
MLELGIFSRTFARRTVDEVFDAVVAHGFRLVHFNFRSAGLDPLPAELSDDHCEVIGRAAEARALRLAGLSATFNAIHPDRDRRHRETALACRAIGCAPLLGAAVVSLCTGTRDPEHMWRGHPRNGDRSAWDDLRRTLELLLEAARAADVVLGIEPERNNVVSTAPRARRLLDQFVGEPLKIVLDPANLLDATSAVEQEDVLAEAFELLAPEVVVLHAKDVSVRGDCAAGQGMLDYQVVFELVNRHALAVPVVLHEVDEDDVSRARDFVLVASRDARATQVERPQ